MMLQQKRQLMCRNHNHLVFSPFWALEASILRTQGTNVFSWDDDDVIALATLLDSVAKIAT
jgi:hypothetical protein